MTAGLVADLQVRRRAFSLRASFALPDGVTAVFGPSGAGKSMLLAALAGLLGAGIGRVEVKGRILDDVDRKLHVRPHQRGVGLVFQDARLFPHLTVRGNLDFAARRATKSVVTPQEAATYFDIQMLLDRSIRNLSGGEKSRVALARALLSAPDLLLLDEPFSALDGPRRRAFLEVLREMHDRFGLPMLVVTHQIDDVAALAAQMIALDNGRVVASGPVAEVANRSDFQALLDPSDQGAPVTMTSPKGAAQAWVRADHVLLANVAPVGLSARHIWEVNVVAVDAEASGSVMVRLAGAAGVLRARVTQAAAEELALAPGVKVWAIVKAHAL
ncbi:MAG: ATP-binding cassette domain-containing protein [Hyphomonadaceae bacterium]|nr:ATP-binding cassette domain-containing protein [Hyphomonadaceae bacterium]